MSDDTDDTDDTEEQFSELREDITDSLSDGIEDSDIPEEYATVLAEEYTVEMDLVSFGFLFTALNDAGQLHPKEPEDPAKKLAASAMPLIAEQSDALHASDESPGGAGYITLPGSIWAYILVSLNITQQVNEPMPASDLAELVYDEVAAELPEEVATVAEHDTPDVSEYNPLMVSAPSADEFISQMVGLRDDDDDSPESEQTGFNPAEATDIEFGDDDGD